MNIGKQSLIDALSETICMALEESLISSESSLLSSSPSSGRLQNLQMLHNILQAVAMQPAQRGECLKTGTAFLTVRILFQPQVF